MCGLARCFRSEFTATAHASNISSLPQRSAMKMSPVAKSLHVLSSIAALYSSAFPQSVAASAESDNAWMFILGVLLVIGVGGIVAWRLSRKEPAIEPVRSTRKRVTYEWKPEDSGAGSKSAGMGRTDVNPSMQGLDIGEVKERMEKIKYSRLPINRLGAPAEPKPVKDLAASLEDELMEAIEDSDSEFVADEAVREAALAVLARHKTSNSIEAISQAALYDLSASLRSKAVTILADFDHESVFETVILSCADPAREVRAAAARAMFRLTFNRADAWTRIANSGDSFKMQQVAKAAIEADFVDRSIDRLVHEDVNYAREALALITLLIRAGESDALFDYLRQGEDLNTKLAILKVFEFVRDEAVLTRLTEMSSSGRVAAEVAAEARQLIEDRIPVVA